jgi:hypothetical protein
MVAVTFLGSWTGFFPIRDMARCSYQMTATSSPPVRAARAC